MFICLLGYFLTTDNIFYDDDILTDEQNDDLSEMSPSLASMAVYIRVLRPSHFLSNGISNISKQREDNQLSHSIRFLIPYKLSSKMVQTYLLRLKVNNKV